MLRLAALDTEDLGVISAHMQDAVLRVGDMVWRSKAKQFALVANRFDWDAQNQPRRCRTGLHFDRVLSVKSQNVRRGEPDAILSLLAVTSNSPAMPLVLMLVEDTVSSEQPIRAVEAKSAPAKKRSVVCM